MGLGQDVRIARAVGPVYVASAAYWVYQPSDPPDESWRLATCLAEECNEEVISCENPAVRPTSIASDPRTGWLYVSGVRENDGRAVLASREGIKWACETMDRPGRPWKDMRVLVDEETVLHLAYLQGNTLNVASKIALLWETDTVSRAADQLAYFGLSGGKMKLIFLRRTERDGTGVRSVASGRPGAWQLASVSMARETGLETFSGAVNDGGEVGTCSCREAERFKKLQGKVDRLPRELVINGSVRIGVAHSDTCVQCIVYPVSRNEFHVLWETERSSGGSNQLHHALLDLRKKAAPGGLVLGLGTLVGDRIVPDPKGACHLATLGPGSDGKSRLYDLSFPGCRVDGR